jgi:hypothetical protein
MKISAIYTTRTSFQTINYVCQNVVLVWIYMNMCFLYCHMKEDYGIESIRVLLLRIKNYQDY